MSCPCTEMSHTVSTEHVMSMYWNVTYCNHWTWTCTEMSHAVSTEHVMSMYWNVCLMMVTVTETRSKLYMIEYIIVSWLNHVLVTNLWTTFKCWVTEGWSTASSTMRIDKHQGPPDIWSPGRPGSRQALVIFQGAVTALGHSGVSAQCVTGAPPPRVRLPWCLADHSLSSGNITNPWS